MMAPSAGGAAGTTLANEMLDVALVPVAVSSSSLEPVKKKLPANLPVIRLKQMARRLFGIEVDQMVLSFRVDKASISEQLDDDDQTLRYFGVSDGGEIFVNEKE
uniref:Ubiquitin-like domain-containing protein n=2 Tax=Phaeomonas parva TaxID=124430 RepID=A0A7S1TRU2_9STRA|mmetsp:Transcript_14870/g.44807  ORF Transcript_14870/g.44807 Transcript_14870/m.44807 type:complete len:104 (+) Transcript_14870:183-494(+)